MKIYLEKLHYNWIYSEIETLWDEKDNILEKCNT